MCQPKPNCGCQHPDKLQSKPGECSPEQIRECHGGEKDHTCCQEG